jgi:hypothetical protein
MITGGEGGDQPGASPAPFCSLNQLGVVTGVDGTRDQLGTERWEGLATTNP